MSYWSSDVCSSDLGLLGLRETKVLRTLIGGALDAGCQDNPFAGETSPERPVGDRHSQGLGVAVDSFQRVLGEDRPCRRQHPPLPQEEIAAVAHFAGEAGNTVVDRQLDGAPLLDLLTVSALRPRPFQIEQDRKSTRLNSSH